MTDLQDLAQRIDALKAEVPDTEEAVMEFGRRFLARAGVSEQEFFELAHAKEAVYGQLFIDAIFEGDLDMGLALKGALGAAFTDAFILGILYEQEKGLPSA